MQTTSHIMMVRPKKFGFNSETEEDNLFQVAISSDTDGVHKKASKEFEGMVDALRDAGVKTSVMDAPQNCDCPDAVFPNNWVSFHLGLAVLYPMKATNRRAERNPKAVADLALESTIIDLSTNEADGKFLEGTGSLILDREHNLAYASISERTDPKLVIEFCDRMDFEPVLFESFHDGDETKSPIYHTNVMLSVGSELAICCFDAIPDEGDKHELRTVLLTSGKKIIKIDIDQMNAFAGNMLEVRNLAGEPLMVMSTTAKASLTEGQIKAISDCCRILIVDIPTIEAVGGGSARCMMAEVFS